MISGGVGITPLLSMLHTIVLQQQERLFTQQRTANFTHL
ncbi:MULTISPECIES: hypothetical protein [Bacillus]|nr:hypothetical protein [Bacillus sonorensis]